MKTVKLFISVFVIFGLVLSVSFFLRTLQTKKLFNIYILDKTVPDRSYTEHKSFNWVLNYNNYVNPKGRPYSYKKDYYGFVPEPQKQYNVRSLRLYQVLTVPDELDMVYYTDTYGVMYEDMFRKQPDSKISPLLYGRLNQNDYLLLSEMKRKRKLILTEFNLLAPPTSLLYRQKVENLFDFKWSGWIGCYIRSLSSGNPYLPQWVQKMYESKYKEKWSFDGPGIVLVKETGEMIVLESGKHLERDFPEILTGEEGQKKYQLPEEQKFPAWFDIIDARTSNKVISKYKIFVNSAGRELMQKEGLSAEFPAIIEHTQDYKFYYFAGDFSDRSLFMGSSYFKGVAEIAKALSYHGSGAKSTFFWRFYVPLLSNILKNNLASGIVTKTSY